MQADTDADGYSAALNRFMVRSESVASPKIERISASALDSAQAIAGNRGNASALSMVAASAALHELITTALQNGHVDLAHITSAHRALMVDDPVEASYAVRIARRVPPGRPAADRPVRALSACGRRVDQLTGAGHIQEITGRKKNRVWAASKALAELDDRDRRIQAAMV